MTDKSKKKIQRDLYIAVISSLGGPAEAARKLGLAKSTVTRYLNGTYSMSPKVAKRCSEITGVDALALSPKMRGIKINENKSMADINELAAKLL